MLRREFVSTLSGAVLSAARPTRIIDTHTHFYDPRRPQGVPWPPKNDPLLYRTVLPEDYKRIARPHGVTGTVVIEASAWLEDNQWVLDLAANDPFLVGLMGHLEPGKPEFRKHLEGLRKNRLFLGIRVNGRILSDAVNVKACAADFDAIAEAGLAVDVIGPSSMFPDLARFAARFRKLRIIIDHLPLDPPNEMRPLGACPNVYAKVSGVLRKVDGRVPAELDYYRPRLDELWQTFGPARLIYGSNWPVCEKIAPYEAVYKLVAGYFVGKGPEAEQQFFWKNSQAAYRWVDRTG
jgi:L-fuconolactonase